jgi:hypothetical protein
MSGYETNTTGINLSGRKESLILVSKYKAFFLHRQINSRGVNVPLIHRRPASRADQLHSNQFSSIEHVINGLQYRHWTDHQHLENTHLN